MSVRLPSSAVTLIVTYPPQLSDPSELSQANRLPQWFVVKELIGDRAGLQSVPVRYRVDPDKHALGVQRKYR